MRARVAAIALAGLGVVLVAGCGDDGGGGPQVVAPVPGETEVRAITGTGTGTVRGTPDRLTVQIGVETRAGNAGEALSRNGDEARRVFEALRDAGVAEDDIQTSQLSVSPFSADDGFGIDGYVVSNTVTATLRDLDRAGAVIDAAAAVAGNDVRIDGVYFEIEDDSELVARARAEAVEQARAQATQLAESAGLELGDVISIEETGTPFPMEEFDAAGGEVASTPIAPGTEELTVSVVVRFAIG